MPLLRLVGVSKRYRREPPPAVDDLSLSMEEGDLLALLGPSGCGKTTTLRLIAGFEDPDEGQVVIADRTVAGAGRAAVPPEQRGVGFVFQDHALFPHLTVEENVAFGLHRQNGAHRRARIGDILDLVGVATLASRYPHELSGGQQQRVAVARALAPAPSVLLLDEPFSNLDADLRGQLREDVAALLRATRTTAVFVTHDQEEAFTIADRVGVLNHGRLEQLAAPETVYHRPATPFVAQFVGAAEFVPGVVTAAGIVTEVGVMPNPDALAAGRSVTIVLRPDDVSFEPRVDAGAVVVDRQFRGSEWLYCLELASGRRLYSSQSSTATVPAGTRVEVRVDPVHVVSFPAG
ncbi:MAG: ABC transporter ATP-binding protein [Candidatus Rokubacteria bacterium]|nr:ABC transporter ATP-binding protein [Candidatus Rokubacteria bacterium]